MKAMAIIRFLIVAVLALMLTSCPSPAPGYGTLVVDARWSDRCDAGIKGEILFSGEGPVFLEDAGEMPAELVDAGKNWIWVKPGSKYFVGWVDYGGDAYTPKGDVTIKAWCMRSGGREPGFSQVTFQGEDYLWNGTFGGEFTVFDDGSDPEETVAPPGPTICLWQSRRVVCDEYRANTPLTSWVGGGP